MSQIALATPFDKPTAAASNRTFYLRTFFFGLLLPLAFAPFHLSGLAILSLAWFYKQLEAKTSSALKTGFFYGLGFFGLGISWLYVSINQYGHLNPILSALITLLLILYQTLFVIAAAVIFRYLSSGSSRLKGGLFSAVWVLMEYCRATFLGGFPWLLIGTGQFDSPLAALLPLIGIYGSSFLTCFLATILANWFKSKPKTLNLKTLYSPVLFLVILLAPIFLKNIQWINLEKKAVSVAVLQENLSMRDKWNDELFQELLTRYQRDVTALLGTSLIVMPESAIPVPLSYVADSLAELHQQALAKNSALILGIPQATNLHENAWYNSLLSLGKARGSYFKQHLVPFGEYFPPVFAPVLDFLGIENSNIAPGFAKQPLVTIHKMPIASSICYELAYPTLLRLQLPQAKFIISLSDDGWFGHSLAMFQQLQIAQVLSALVGRYQVVANNDGLSSVLDSKGKILASLPAFKEGILNATLYPANGSTPWIYYGDSPVLVFAFVIALICLVRKNLFLLPLVSRVKRRYPYQPE